MIGLINIVRCCGEHTRSRDGFFGALLGTVVLVIALVAGLSWLYEAASSALVGIAASTAEANRIAGWAISACLVLIVGGIVVWVLLGRRRDVRDEPVREAFTAATDRALEARRQAAALPTAARQALDSRPPGSQLSEGYWRMHAEHVESTRLDRLPEGGGRS